MADTVDSKSTAREGVPVQVRGPVLIFYPVFCLNKLGFLIVDERFQTGDLKSQKSKEQTPRKSFFDFVLAWHVHVWSTLISRLAIDLCGQAGYFLTNSMVIPLPVEISCCLGY